MLQLYLSKAENVDNTKIEDNEASLITFLEGKERTDTEMHDYADSIGMNPHELEGIVYKIAHKALTGKYLKHWGDPETNFDPEELALGISIEKEHTGDKHIATVIAKAHLSELKDYYTRLKKMGG